jgi:tripartite-type tricarboxylate transporter receptor subunit TctC
MRVIALLAALVVAGSMMPAAAQTFPTRPVKLVVPFPPGGPLDIIGREIAKELTDAWGQSVIDDNKPGAGGNIGADYVAKSPADGYTVVMGALSTHAVNPSLYPKMPYDARRDFAPITLVAITPNVLVINPSLPVHSVKELIAYAKAHPGKLSFGSGSIGSAGHLAGELFKVDAGIDMVHVPYKGGGVSVQGVMTGQVQLTFENPATALPMIATGSVRALAVTSEARSPHLPEVPTMIESGIKDFATVSFFGLVVKAGTPDALVARLNAAVNQSLAAPEARTALAKLSLDVSPGSSAEFASYLARERDKWEEIARLAHVEVE